MINATETAISAVASRCISRSVGVSFWSKPGLNTTVNWKPNNAWMPGRTMRHSSRRFLAAWLSDNSSLSP